MPNIKRHILDHIIIGREPNLTGTVSEIAIIRALNWYSYSCDIKKTRIWILDWMASEGYTKKDISLYKQSSHRSITQTKASVARLLTNGMISPELEKSLRSHLKIVLNAKNPTPTRPKAIRVFNQLIADIDDLLDQFYRSNYKILPDITSISVNRKLAYVRSAVKYYQEILDEIKSEKPSAARKRYIKLLENIVNQIC